MKTLVTNDDGVQCPGLWAIVAEMRKLGDVVVVAPDREQSGVGTSVTFHSPLRIKEVKPLIEGVPVYSVEGTPADSVILALRYLFTDEINLVVSGINEGANLGSDVYISGTVGAALQGFLFGLPSIAISVGSLKNPFFEPAARVAMLLGDLLIKSKNANDALPQQVLLNVNLPNLTVKQLRGIKITRLSFNESADGVHEGYDGRRRYYWIVRQKDQWPAEPGTDRWALKQNYISITPFLSHVPSGAVSSILHEIAPSLFKQLKATYHESSAT